MGKKMSKESYFEVHNNTNRNITNTIISDVNDHDWIEDNRPNKNLVGRFIPHGGGKIREREQLCGYDSHCPFTMKLEFSDGTNDVFRVHQMYAISDCCDQIFQHYNYTHDIEYQRINGNTLRVTVVNTQDQLVNQKAEEVNKRGEEALKRKNYELAVRKFRAAKRIAKERSTINMIERNLKQAENADRAHKLNEEGESAIRRKSYTYAMQKFDEALTIANEISIRENIMENKNALRLMLYRQKQNERAIETNRDGEEAFTKGEYEKAVQKFKQAYRLSNEMSTIDLIKRNLTKATNVYNAQQKNEEGRQLLKQKKYEAAIKKFDEALRLAEGSSLLTTVNNNKLQALVQNGRALYNEGWRLESNENEDMSKEAEESFRKARDFFKIANSLDNLRLVEMKIAGNELFNEGASLEQEASKLYEKARKTQMVDSYATAQRKYEEVLKKYKEAREKLKEGASNDEMFSSNVNYVRDQIDRVSGIVKKIVTANLSEQVGRVMFDTQRNDRKDEVIDTVTNVHLVSDAV